MEIQHAKLLQSKNALYSMVEGDLTVVTIPSGLRQVTATHVFNNKLPKRLVCCFLSNEDLNGDFSIHPFTFTPRNVERIAVTVDGEHVFGSPLQCDFAQNLYMQAYQNLHTVIGKSYDAGGINITYKDYAVGSALFCFDLSSGSFSRLSDQFSVERNGNFRLAVSFTESTTETLHMMLYGEFDRVIEVNNRRDVLLS